MVVVLFIATALYGVAIFLVTALFLRHLASVTRRHDRHVDQLLDRLAHAHGRTWTPAPAQQVEEELAAIVAAERPPPLYDPDQEV